MVLPLCGTQSRMQSPSLGPTMKPTPWCSRSLPLAFASLRTVELKKHVDLPASVVRTSWEQLLAFVSCNAIKSMLWSFIILTRCSFLPRSIKLRQFSVAILMVDAYGSCFLCGVSGFGFWAGKHCFLLRRVCLIFLRFRSWRLFSMTYFCFPYIWRRWLRLFRVNFDIFSPSVENNLSCVWSHWLRYGCDVLGFLYCVEAISSRLVSWIAASSNEAAITFLIFPHHFLVQMFPLSP